MDSRWKEKLQKHSLSVSCWAATAGIWTQDRLFTRQVLWPVKPQRLLHSAFYCISNCDMWKLSNQCARASCLCSIPGWRGANDRALNMWHLTSSTVAQRFSGPPPRGTTPSKRFSPVLEVKSLWMWTSHRQKKSSCRRFRLSRPAWMTSGWCCCPWCWNDATDIINYFYMILFEKEKEYEMVPKWSVAQGVSPWRYTCLSNIRVEWIQGHFLCFNLAAIPTWHDLCSSSPLKLLMVMWWEPPVVTEHSRCAQ